MSQIAQQDHLYLEDEGTIAGLHQPTKDKLKHCVVDGTILDVVLITKEVGNKRNISKVVAYEQDVENPKKPSSKVIFLNSNTGALHGVNLEAL